MEGNQIQAIQRVSERLHDLADAFPDFRYLELAGPALTDKQFTRATITAIAAGANCHYEHNLTDMTAICVYGHDLDAAVETLRMVADEIWLTVRQVQWHFHFDDATVPDEMPAVREVGIPFILISTLVHMAIEFPRAIAEEMANLGVAFPEGRGGMAMYQGLVEVQGGCLVLPGNTLIPPGGCRTTDYARVVAAASRGEFSVLYSLSPAFALLGAFFDACLMMSQVGRKIEESHRRGSGAEQATPEQPGQLIPPSEQATMLGWAKPTSIPTLKRVAALRRAVLARGMKLDEQKERGRGNKTFVPREQWVGVATLFKFVAPTAPDADKAIAAIGQGVRLMNTTGLSVSYRCDGCGEITRNDAVEPECGHCHKCDRLRPLTSLSRK